MIGPRRTSGPAPSSNAPSTRSRSAATKQQRNNLVPWDGRYGPSTIAHAIFLAARARPDARALIERWLFDAFAGKADPEILFERFQVIAGNGYALAAYLFFLLDDERFAPIAPRTFDEAFRRLGIPLTTSSQCSWPNYSAYNEALEDVRRELQSAGFPDARHIDAHSFCWMLIRMEEDGPGGANRPGTAGRSWTSSPTRRPVEMRSRTAAANAFSESGLPGLRKRLHAAAARQAVSPRLSPRGSDFARGSCISKPAKGERPNAPDRTRSL